MRLHQRVDLLRQKDRSSFGLIVVLQTEVIGQFGLVAIQVRLHNVRRVELVHVSIDRVHLVDLVVIVGVWIAVHSEELQRFSMLDVHVFR